MKPTLQVIWPLAAVIATWQVIGVVRVMAESRDDAMIQELNATYYNLPGHGVHQWTCEVADSAFQQTRNLLAQKLSQNDSRLAALEVVRFSIRLDREGRCFVESSTGHPTGNTHFDQSLTEMVHGSLQMLQGFCDTWSEYAMQLRFVPEGTPHVTQTQDGYSIMYQRHGISYTVLLDSRLQEHEVIADNHGQLLHMVPQLAQEPSGRLLKGFVLKTDNGQEVASTIIEYQEVNGVQIPQRVAIHTQQPPKSELIFTRCKIEGQ